MKRLTEIMEENDSLEEGGTEGGTLKLLKDIKNQLSELDVEINDEATMEEGENNEGTNIKVGEDLASSLEGLYELVKAETKSDVSECATSGCEETAEGAGPEEKSDTSSRNQIGSTSQQSSTSNQQAGTSQDGTSENSQSESSSQQSESSSQQSGSTSQQSGSTSQESGSTSQQSGST